jgi:hypothetical protein
MKLFGLHLLLSYKCTLACDHCFVWGSPWQNGTLTLPAIQLILQQAVETGTVTRICFEGGEPFLFYATLLRAAQEAAGLGFKVGVVTNAFWAHTEADALANLEPFAGLVQDLTLSSDLFHTHGPQEGGPQSELLSRQAAHASSAARKLGIPVSLISIALPEATGAAESVGQLPAGQSKIMYRGRAADKLADRVAGRPWEEFTACPHENLREPGRVHLDPLGNLHLCQGISPGNLFQTPLSEICARYDPEAHPILGPLLQGGPAELVRQFNLAHAETYADACHLCYKARLALRLCFPQTLGPDQMYGFYG